MGVKLGDQSHFTEKVSWNEGGSHATSEGKAFWAETACGANALIQNERVRS